MTKNKKGRNEEEKGERLEKLGWKKEEYEEKIGEEVRKEIIGRERIRHRLEVENKLANSKYCKEIRWIINNEEKTPKYLEAEKELSRKEVIKVARHRMGNEARANRYWKDEERRRCRLCREEEETIKHIWEECKVSGSRQEGWEEKITEKRERMWRLEGLRKKMEEKRKREEEEKERSTNKPRERLAWSGKSQRED